ncbi:hypothetical protein OS493_002816 [Desmophyllum pertusum]|uniref:J domain-containing protein n=1 Tax=Desmophyllum pertusum TaxID=174260 RepID=A0A9W9YFX5_9CNID|nr:hypothetical protein OS493_002816 [Desmophyllum pertusum]
MDEEKYKSLLIVNESSDAQVTLYIYPRWDFICWLSVESKIIKPGEKNLHRSDEKFKFELVARFEDKRPKKILLEPEMWVEDKLLKISESLVLTEGKLADFPQEKRVCLRNLQRDKELSTDGRRNLYEILGLNMNQARKMTKEEQVEAIKKGFRKQIQRWHPDKNFGDDENAKEIIMAHDILLDEEKRARYHNEADYDGGWLSLKRYKAIFRPERFSEEQKRAYKHRMMMFALSFGIIFGGVVLSVFTAGLATPALVATGAVFGGALTGAGLQSLQHTVKKKSVVDECNKKEWLMKAGIGFVGGAATGGAAAGIMAGVAGLGSAAMESAAVTAGQYVGIGAATGAVGGVTTSLASDAGRKFVDGEEVTWKQALGHAVIGAGVGAAAGAAGGIVTKSVVGSHTSAASANLEVEVGEQIVILTGARRLGNALARNIPRVLTENGTEAVMGTMAQIAEERLDDSVENQSPGEHVVKGVKNVATNAAIGLAKEGGGALVSLVWNEIKVTKRVNKEHKTPLIDDQTGTSVGVGKKEITRDGVRYDVSIEDNEQRIKCRHMRATYQKLDTDEPSTDEPMSRVNTIFEEDDDVLDEPDAVPDPAEDGHIKYISDGAWISKMVVSYFLDGIEDTQEVSGSGKYVTIPSKARRIEVRFQVRRPFWGDIKKYDRFKKCWCQPDEPHVFRYDTPPPLRTFTISGNLWWEAVMGVSDEYLADEDDPEEGQFKYISDGAWISKMIVSYFLDGKKHTQVVSGSGKYVTVPSKATRIEVRFQVARPFWGYIKKYDRFQRCWCQPDEPHVFRYDTPPSHRTFTISGNLWWEAVMGVSDEYLADEDDPEEGQFKYISDGAWISKMIVSYFLDGKKHTQVVSGSGKYVTVPSKATRIEVRFQVARPFGVTSRSTIVSKGAGASQMSRTCSGTTLRHHIARLPSVATCGGKLS